MEQNSNRKGKNNIVPYRLHRFKINDEEEVMRQGSTLGRNSPSVGESIEQQTQSIFRKSQPKSNVTT